MPSVPMQKGKKTLKCKLIYPTAAVTPVWGMPSRPDIAELTFIMFIV